MRAPLEKYITLCESDIAFSVLREKKKLIAARPPVKKKILMTSYACTYEVWVLECVICTPHFLVLSATFQAVTVYSGGGGGGGR